MKSFTIIACALSMTGFVSAHGFISKWGISGQGLVQAQKTGLSASSFRSSPDNTGWIGSNFLTSDAIACGSSNTPFDQVASPGGTFFGAANQGAGQQLAIQAGQSIEVVVSGNPGVGWPHRTGHVQAYMADCGASCTNFNAVGASFFKIHSELNGLGNTLVPAFNSGLDGNPYKVAIPSSLASGNYIFRFELIAFGQSAPVEGLQDQYYPFCGQLKVTGSGTTSASKLETVTFPGGYKNGKINPATAPGPAVFANGSGPGTVATPTPPTAAPPAKSSAPVTPPAKSPPKSSSTKHSLPKCANTCLNIKISQAPKLGAAKCAATDLACMCGSESFKQAFYTCNEENCGNCDQVARGDDLFDAMCAKLVKTKKMMVKRDSMKKHLSASSRMERRYLHGSNIRSPLL